MKLSIVVSTNKTNYWYRFCESLSHNSVALEVIFVGPVGLGNGKLPVPTKFIDIDVNAAQCWEIGSRAATGDMLGFAADDCVFTPGFLDAVGAAALNHHNPHDMFTGRYVHNHVDQFPGQRFLSLAQMPTLPVGGFSYTETHRRIGGIDRRFAAVLWDTDLYSHLYELGGRTTYFENHTCHELNAESKLFVNNHAHDMAVIKSLWPKNIAPDMRRTSERQRYTDAETARGTRYDGVA